jgi:serine/threonine protein kinase
MSDAESKNIDNSQFIKHIGKGSFSNVFLYKKNSQLTISSIFDENTLFTNDKKVTEQKYYIIKEVNLNVLVDKYLKSRKKPRNRSKQNSSIIVIQKENKNTIPIKRDVSLNSYKNLNLTPYSTYAKHRVTPTINVNYDYNSEEEYYYKKLKTLIDSEIDILKILDHPNIITYMSNTFSNDIFYIKMEYCDYGDLTNLLKSNNFSRNVFNGFNENIINKFLLDTSAGLLYIHSLNIVHRDIKLQNILVKNDHSGCVFKISDFGFACNIPIASESQNKQDNSLEQDFNFDKPENKKYFKLCGTPYYMAPEMISNVNKFEQLINSSETNSDSETKFTKSVFYDTKVDLWSYGICLYELLFNILPFTNMSEITDLKIFYSRDTTQTVINKNINEKDIISDNMKCLLKKLLSIDPDSRFTTKELYDYIRSHICTIEPIIQPIKQIDSTTPIESVKFKVNMDSWVQINKNEETDSNNSIMKISVDRPFMTWLLEKK